jgi:hypothetical protein
VLQAYTILTDDAHCFCLDVTPALPAKHGALTMFEPSRLAFHEVPVERLRLAIPRVYDAVKLATRVHDKMDAFKACDARFNLAKCNKVLAAILAKTGHAESTLPAAPKARAEVARAVAEAAKEAKAEAAEAAFTVRRERRVEAEATVAAFVVTGHGVKQAVRVEPVHGAADLRACTIRRKWNDQSRLTSVTVAAGDVHDAFEPALAAWRARKGS